MKYKGLCEQYGPMTVAIGAMVMPVGLEAALSNVFNYNADYTAAMGAGAWSYVITHFAGHAAAEYYLRDKGAEMGPTRASHAMQRIQAAVYAGVIAGFMAYNAMPDDETRASEPIPLSSAERHAQARPALPGLVPAPSRFVPL